MPVSLARSPLAHCHPLTVRRQLHRDDAVSFAGYKIPHPLEYQMLIKVRYENVVQLYV